MADGSIHAGLGETALYRHFDAGGKLLYVGISLSAVARLSQHRTDSHWFRRIANMTTEWFPTREAAIRAERDAVRHENPECNIVYKETMSEREFRLRREAELSRQQLSARTVLFKPVYTVREVYELLGYGGPTVVKNLIAAGTLGHVTVGSKTLVTGWQLIDYLEALGGKRP